MKKEFMIAGAPAYCTHPDDGKKHPGLIVIEEIWGMNAHIKNVCDRFAAEGFDVLSVELLPKGILEKLNPSMQVDLFDPEKRDALQPVLREAMQPISQPEYGREAIATLTAAVDFLIKDEHSDGNVAVLGFCFGGTYSFQLAAHDARIRAAVPFYGQPLSGGDVAKVSCPILAFYGDEDVRLMETLPALREAMEKSGKQFEAVVYEGAGHAFFNDTNPRQYRPEAAKDAWNRSLAFLRTHLGK